MANPTPESIVEVVGVSVANKGMAVGAVTGAVGWLSQVNWIGIAGVVVAVVGLLVSTAINTYFQMRRDRRESAESAERIKALREQCRP
ncbi:Bacteriophage holin family, superfamily II-like [Pseudomonas sp. LAMO17WK12:I10]|uniref:holin n=1 Tax=unclassified Pseudomonas TaxID=196821 RepID=UPI000BCC99B6|nr:MULTISPECIES: holin [unclassified Pseudomonas]PXX60697.1 holin family protein (superfamily II) [Pseudomonas sp. LAMO17WK12:I9]SNY45521.1 Bacteriophage holin family, superfamily II-like [Pseudomonas sp. LAMO17WK12:I10]